MPPRNFVTVIHQKINLGHVSSKTSFYKVAKSTSSINWPCTCYEIGIQNLGHGPIESSLYFKPSVLL